MKRRSFMQLGLGLGAGLVTVGSGPSVAAGNPVPLHWSSRTLNAMGSSMALRAGHPERGTAEQALDAAVADIRHVEDQMSLFRPDSALCQLNRTGYLENPHPDLLEVLHTAQQVSRRSQGAFDVTVQPLWLAFEHARQQGRLPRAQEVLAARKRVGWAGVQLESGAIRLAAPGMGITLNGIAQGFAADKVKKRLQRYGIAHALIDAGEWASLGQPDHAGDWTLGLANPRDAQQVLTRMAMQGHCVATSADNLCTFSPDFVHHHILDPHTGYSPCDVSCVSVVASTAMVADALTKVFFMAGFAQALPLAKAWNVEVLVVDKKGRWRASPGVALQQA